MDPNQDDRFAQVYNDPRFRSIPKSKKKVKVDARFKTMLTDNKFQSKLDMDKRGKVIRKDNKIDLHRFYEASSDEKDDSDDDDDDDDEEIKNEEDEQLQDKKSLTKVKPKIPDARGLDDDDDEENSSDDSESEESEDDEEEVEIDHGWAELDKNVPQIENITHRIAICNVDWDKIKAVDLFMLANSFKPSGGCVKSVKIYPSEFGKERMKTEEERGPAEFIRGDDGEGSRVNLVVNEDVIDDEDDVHNYGDEEEIDVKSREKLRKYQIERLKYYYAVVDCDSSETANQLYQELDGFEYESSSSTLDLRFIPDDMTFEDTPSSECDSLPDMSSYKAPQFVTNALQQCKVELTWDEDDQERKEKLQRAFTNPDAGDDLSAYLASSSEDEDDQDEEEDEDENNEDKLSNDMAKMKNSEKINKYKQLLNSLEEKEEEDNEGMEMEITWEPGLEEKTEKMVENKKKDKDRTEFEINLSRKREDRTQKAREEKDMVDESEDESESEDDSESNDEDEEDSESEQVKVDKKKGKDKKNTKKKGMSSKDKANIKVDDDLDLLLMETSEQNKHHFNYAKMTEDGKGKKKRPQTDEDNFKFDAIDSRFSAIYSSHEYNIDPSDPHFKKTDAFEQIINQQKNKFKSKGDDVKMKSQKEADKLKNLVESVKAKSKRQKVLK